MVGMPSWERTSSVNGGSKANVFFPPFEEYVAVIGSNSGRFFILNFPSLIPFFEFVRSPVESVSSQPSSFHIEDTGNDFASSTQVVEFSQNTVNFVSSKLDTFWKSFALEAWPGRSDACRLHGPSWFTVLSRRQRI